MKNIHLTIRIYLVAAVVSACTCFAAENKAEQNQQDNQQNQQQPESRQQLQSIEKSVSLQKKLIQKRYQNRIDNLRMLARRYAENLGYPDRLLWVEFIKMTRGENSADRYFLTPSFLEYKTFRLRDAMMRTYSVYAAQNLLLDDRAYEVMAGIESGGSYNTISRRQARKVLNIMQELRLISSRIERQRKEELAHLERWQKKAAEDISGAVSQLKVQPPAAKPGVVTAIIYSPKICSAMINDEVLHDGDSLGDVKILKIHPDKVNFERNGQVWTQELGKAYEKFWQ
jgi:hypothetical protein